MQLPDNEGLPETTLTSKKTFEGVLLHVFRDEVRLTDGSTSIREWIDHPGAAAVVPVFEDGSTLLVQQYRYAARRSFIEVPAGKIDQRGEDPIITGARELEEETGWCSHSMAYLGAFYPGIGYSNEVIHIYLARALIKGNVHSEEGEILEVVRLPFAEAMAKVRNGEILDMKSALALRMADDFLREEAQGC